MCRLSSSLFSVVSSIILYRQFNERASGWKLRSFACGWDRRHWQLLQNSVVLQECISNPDTDSIQAKEGEIFVLFATKTGVCAALEQKSTSEHHWTSAMCVNLALILTQVLMIYEFLNLVTCLWTKDKCSRCGRCFLALVCLWGR